MTQPVDHSATKWRINKEISVPDIISFVAAVAAVVVAYSTLDTRLRLVEQAIVTQKETDHRQDQDSLRYQGRIEEALRGLSLKLDRLIERAR